MIYPEFVCERTFKNADKFTMKRITGLVADLQREQFVPATLIIHHDRIQAIEPIAHRIDGPYLLPGFVDAHVHIESSMLVPSEFARLAVVHGTVATVSDPHEIANVLGLDGIQFMLENGRRQPFTFCWGAPSCVPATPFETAGAELDATAIATLLSQPEIGFLSEVMNYPAVLQGDPHMHAKIQAALQADKPVDGHAPGLKGQQAIDYIRANAAWGTQPIITTDHECVDIDEARWKLQHGMKVLIREGSAAKNFDALIDLLREFPDRIMFCTDDKHPNDLVQGHINQLVRRAVAAGLPLWSVLKAACYHPVQHYRLRTGLLRLGDRADFIVLENLRDFIPMHTYLGGDLVAEQGKTLLPHLTVAGVNRFFQRTITPDELAVAAEATQIKIIEVIDGSLLTRAARCRIKPVNGCLASDVTNDVLKLTVVNRYEPAPPAVAFVRNFGLQRGAIASSVAHDSHNIVAVGADDEPISRAVNLLMQHQGGLAAVDGEKELVLPLPVAGLMTDADGYITATRYEELDQMAKDMGSRLRAPFMTLSFVALLVIPELKLSDRGLFDVYAFRFTSLFD